MFGSQTAITVGMVPLTAKVVDMDVKSTYNELNAIPIPRFSPIPPRTFFEDKETPIKVMIIADKGIEYRL